MLTGTALSCWHNLPGVFLLERECLGSNIKTDPFLLWDRNERNVYSCGGEEVSGCAQGGKSVAGVGSDHLVNGFGGGWDNPAAPRCGQTMPGARSSVTAGDKGEGMELLRVCGMCFIEGPGKDVVLHIVQREEREPKCSPGALQGGPAPALGTGSTAKGNSLCCTLRAGGIRMEEPGEDFSAAGLLETP